MRKPLASSIVISKNRARFPFHLLIRLSIPLLLGGCGGMRSMLDPKGPQAQAIANIGWVMLWGAAAILALVMALALYAIYRHPDQRRPISANTWIIGGGVVFPVVTLSVLLFYGVVAMGDLRTRPSASAASIEVVGNQWWWDVHYRDADGRITTSANEIHIPSGTPVTVLLRTNDVIHSFWVPNLTGKMDLIPGRINHVVLHADAPGTFRGQCAEFCGAQHARMAFQVIAQTPEAHAAWLVRRRAPLAAPTNAILLRGRQAFVAHCIECHTVRGVGTAHARGPDLTHVASRQFLAAGTLENNRANLIRFITYSQAIKPGNRMPSHAHLGPEKLELIATYLESLR